MHFVKRTLDNQNLLGGGGCEGGERERSMKICSYLKNVNNPLQKSLLPVYLSLEEPGRKKIYVEMVRNSLEIQRIRIPADNFHKTTAVLVPTGSCAISSCGFQCLLSAPVVLSTSSAISQVK